MNYTKIQNKEVNEGHLDLNINLNSEFDKQNEKIISNIYSNMKFSQYMLLILIILFSILLILQQKNIIYLTKVVESKNYTIEYNNIINTYEKEKERGNNEDIYRKESFDSMSISFKKAKNFLEANIKNKLIKEIPFVPIIDPIVSVVIPVYNCEKYISQAIRSIQNQNIIYLEIILVYEKSKDKTLSIIQKMQEEDDRIKIVNNTKSMGTLYSRCIGALSAKGKYIFPLDSTDMFLDDDVFENIVTIAEKGYFDIVEFKGIESLKGGINILKNRINDISNTNRPLNLVLFQPQLGNYQIWPEKDINSYHIEDTHLWGKCIRTDLYKKTINLMGEERYSRYILSYEDIIMNYALFNTADSYKFVGKYGIFHVNRVAKPLKNNTFVASNIHKIYYLDVMTLFVKNKIANKKILVHFLINLFEDNMLENDLMKNKQIKDLFISCIDKILKMDKISDEYKNEIRIKGGLLTFIDYDF